MDLGLKGKRAIVTGGSKGIGRRCADILADEGAHVSICARNAEEVEAAVAGLRAKGVKAHGGTLDVGDKAALEGWVADSAAAPASRDSATGAQGRLGIGGSRCHVERRSSTRLPKGLPSGRRPVRACRAK